MSIFSNLKKAAEGVMGNMTKEFKKVANRELLEGTIAACVWVSSANGVFKSEEKEKVLGAIKRDPHLNMFKQSDVVSIFNDYASTFEFDINMGIIKAKDAIENSCDDSIKGKMLVAICCAIGAADGDFDKDEREVVRQICGLVGVNPREFHV